MFWYLGSESTACEFFVLGGEERGFFVAYEDDQPGCFEGYTKTAPARTRPDADLQQRLPVRLGVLWRRLLRRELHRNAVL